MSYIDNTKIGEIKMKKFTVEVCRTSWQFNTFEVEANNEEEAEKKAEQMAYNTVFPNNGNAEYTIESVESKE